MGQRCTTTVLVFAAMVSALAWGGDLQLDAFRATVFPLTSYAGTRELASGNAVVVAHDGLLVTTATLVEGADRVVLGAIPATIVTVDRGADLALLRVAGDPPPATFATVAPNDGEAVAVVGHWGESDALAMARGVTTRHDPFQSHTALFGAGGFGSLLVNECGEAVGINRANPQDKADAPRQYAVAATLPQIEAFVARSGGHLLHADKPCLSAVLLARKSADDALARAEEAEARARMLQTSVNVSQREKAAALAAARQARALATAAEARRATAENSALVAQHLALKRHADAMAAKRAEELARKRALWGWIGAGVLVLLAAILAGVLISRARARRELAESEALAAREEVVRSNVPPEGAHDLLLEGSSPGGEKFAIKIPALALAEHRGGAVIGRNPDEAEFVVNHARVSRRHCRLFVADRELLLEDLHSTNGTELNGATVSAPSPVYEGDEITIGDVVLRLKFRDTARSGERWGSEF